MTCPCVAVEAVTQDYEESRREMRLCLSVDALWNTVLQDAETQAYCHQWSQKLFIWGACIC